jgi:hypothetical protein
MLVIIRHVVTFLRSFVYLGTIDKSDQVGILL